jgi:hypothetical protein
MAYLNQANKDVNSLQIDKNFILDAKKEGEDDDEDMIVTENNDGKFYCGLRL